MWLENQDVGKLCTLKTSMVIFDKNIHLWSHYVKTQFGEWQFSPPQVVAIGHSVVSDSWWPRGLQPARLLYPWDFPGKNTGMGCHFLLQGILPTQGWTSYLLHWEVGSFPLSLRIGSSLLLGPFILFRPSIEWMVPTHIREAKCLAILWPSHPFL